MADFNQQAASQLVQRANTIPSGHDQSQLFWSAQAPRRVTRSLTRAKNTDLSSSTQKLIAQYQTQDAFKPTAINNSYLSPLSSLPSSMISTPGSLRPSLIIKLPLATDNIKANRDIAGPSVITGKRKSRSNTPDMEYLTESHHGSDSNKPALKRTARTRVTTKATSKGFTKTAPKAAYYTNVQQDKPEPYGQPAVWAEKRQQLCETLPYYRAYQSGAYIADGSAHGFLCDKEVGDRDVFTDNIIIARVGGGKKMMDNTGKRVQTESQDISTIANSFRKSQERYKPIAVIAGQGNSISPSKLPHYYNVLDWFHVTDVWCEKYDRLTRWMVRLERINLDQKSWWSAKSAPHFHPNFESPKAEIFTCNSCNKGSKLIYKQGWVCLETSCNVFFNFGQDIDDKTLQFTQDFIQERTQFHGNTPETLAPPLLTDQDLNAMEAFGFEEQYKKGIVCPKCGCCSRRIEWRQWICENFSCDFTYSVTQRPISALVTIRHSAEKRLMPKEQPLVSPSIRASEFTLGNYQVFHYVLRGKDGEDIGFICHLKANLFVIEQPNGPNELFEEMQSHDLGLKRSASLQKGAIGEVLTAHWATNWGAPYKYKVSQHSRPFNQAPPVIIKALKRLTWAGKHAVTAELEQFQDFNELLSVGYFEEGHMSYHDDGEKTLGPTVASLSLGCTSTMHFRPKSNNSIGKTDEKQNKNAKGTKRDVLRIKLEHGDIMVMHGHQIQELYEHSLVPHGKLRFALTCRYVRPDMMANDEERQYTITAGALPQGSHQYDYNGDIQASPTVGPSLSIVPQIVRVSSTAAPQTVGASSTALSIEPSTLLPTAANPLIEASSTVGLWHADCRFTKVDQSIGDLLRSGGVTPPELRERLQDWLAYFLSMYQH